MYCNGIVPAIAALLRLMQIKALRAEGQRRDITSLFEMLELVNADEQPSIPIGQKAVIATPLAYCTASKAGPAFELPPRIPGAIRGEYWRYRLRDR